ncbi:MAG: sterol desaturase family protein [Sphingomonadales bacterium]|nr:sterol desaturase family protein [Sphingomonadales bacterium]
MNNPLIASLATHYEGTLSLIAAVAIIALSVAGGKLLTMLVPPFREAARINAEAYATKMQKPNYAANQAWNRKWGAFYWVAIFGVILPFCITADPQPWWRVLRDMVVILMFYDFFYYLVHRFLFHDGGLLGGPLMWVHAVHHRQHNPCRNDSSYIHPIEVGLGLGLYAASIFVLSHWLGNFHVVTIIVTWLAFSHINLQNHNLWEADRFPFKYLKYMSAMHHHHHAMFTGGNFATISLLYDWMFGTIDHGEGHKSGLRPGKARPPVRAQ